MSNSKKSLRVLTLALATVAAVAASAPSWAAPAAKSGGLPPLVSVLPGMAPPALSATPRTPVRQTVSYSLEVRRSVAEPSARAEVALPQSTTYLLSALAEEEAGMSVSRRYALPCGEVPSASPANHFCGVNGSLQLSVKPLALGENSRLKATYVSVAMREPESASAGAPASTVLRVVETRQVLPFTLGKPHTLALGDYSVTVTALSVK